MKSKVGFAHNSINIQTPITGIFMISLFGATLGSVGIYELHKINAFDHLLIGLGIIFLSIGLFFILNSKYYKILINEQPGFLSLVESTGWDISPLKIPFKYFTEIIVQHIINRDIPEFGVMLRNRMGALLLLAKFNDEKKALNFAKRLEKTIGLQVRVNHDISLNLIDRNHPFEPYKVILPNQSKLTIKEKKDSMELSWNITYHPLQIVFMFGVYYGFFHIIHFVIVPFKGINIFFAIVIYLLLGIILSFLITVIISSWFRSHNVIINRETITFFNRLFDRRYAKRVMNKSDIYLIRSSIEFSNEEMVIISRKGIDFLNDMIKKYAQGKKEFKKLMDTQDRIVFKEEIIRLNVSNKKLSEKLFIEQFILKNL